MKILAFIEQRDAKLKSSATELLALAYKLAGTNPANVVACTIGKADVSALSGCGADEILSYTEEAGAQYNVLTFSKIVQTAIEQTKPDIVLGVASPMGKDFFPRLAARNNAAIITDAVQASLDGNALVAVKPLYAGKALATMRAESGLRFLTIRPNVFPHAKPNAGSAKQTSLAVADATFNTIKTLEIRKGSSERPDLAEATVVISGGRSLGSADKFKILFDCADVVGAAVGASRAAVDAGYASHDMQVGQTGKTVNPNLYIACGVSGSIQHMAGMRTSKCIVAVNTDPEAPIYNIADYGIVADLFEVVPAMNKKFKELLGK